MPDGFNYARFLLWRRLYAVQFLFFSQFSTSWTPEETQLRVQFLFLYIPAMWHIWASCICLALEECVFFIIGKCVCVRVSVSNNPPVSTDRLSRSKWKRALRRPCCKISVYIQNPDSRPNNDCSQEDIISLSRHNIPAGVIFIRMFFFHVVSWDIKISTSSPVFLPGHLGSSCS